MLATNETKAKHSSSEIIKPEIFTRSPETRFPVVRERVADRVNALGLGPTRLAQEAKLNRTYITDILEGRKRSVNGRERLERLAKALGVTPAYLTGAKAAQGRIKPADDGGLALQGIIAEGVSRRRPEAAMLPTVAVQADARYPGAQGVFAVADNDLTTVGAPAGSWLLAVAADDFLRVTGGYRPGQLVIVALTDTAGEELVVRRVVMFSDRVELHPVAGSGPIYTLGRHPRLRRMSIRGVVLKAIQELA